MNESKKPYASVGGTELSLWDITKILLAKIHWLLLAGVVVAAGVLCSSNNFCYADL